MKFTLHVNGLVFESAITDKISVEKAKSAVYENIENMNKLEMESSDGSFVVIGKDALQSAVLIFSEA